MLQYRNNNCYNTHSEGGFTPSPVTIDITTVTRLPLAGSPSFNRLEPILCKEEYG